MKRMRTARDGWFLSATVVTLLSAPIPAQSTQLVSVNSSGVQASGLRPSISADARYVAFVSHDPNLVPGDTNFSLDVFVRDRQTGQTTRASVSSAGNQVFQASEHPVISADGRFVAFTSLAGNLVPGDTNGVRDVFVHDNQTGQTTRATVNSAGVEANADWSAHDSLPSISGDGRYVAFSSMATNLVAGDTNGWEDAFVHDRVTGQTTRVSVDSAGAEATHASTFPALSADGRYVVFLSHATNLVAGDTNGGEDAFVHDRTTGQTTRVSVGSMGEQADLPIYPFFSISADGRQVAFYTDATTLVPGDTNAMSDVFVHDRQTGQTTLASVSSSGAQGDGGSGNSAISADGRYVPFESTATNLVAGDTNAQIDVFLRDLLTSQTTRVNVDSAGAQSAGGQLFGELQVAISADGRYVGFGSNASNLAPGDTNGVADVFLRDRVGGAGFTSVCDAGVGGVIGCPCLNPPAGPGRGCDNSAGTGGAILAAYGGAYLSSDTLVLVTSQEKPTALSIVTQWTGASATGAVFGMGVRCTSGTFKRLYTKTAVGGSITAPNFGAGDPQVSVRSAALGDPIAPGQSRWLLVYYRDPIVLGGCPATGTFNATQTGQVTWSP